MSVTGWPGARPPHDAPLRLQHQRNRQPPARRRARPDGGGRLFGRRSHAGPHASRPVHARLGGGRAPAPHPARRARLRERHRDGRALPARPAGQARADLPDRRPGRSRPSCRLPEARGGDRGDSGFGSGLVLGRRAEARGGPRRRAWVAARRCRGGRRLCGRARRGGGAGARARDAGRDGRRLRGGSGGCRNCGSRSISAT